jgi:hypothetical protein
VLREEVAGPLGVADEFFFGVPEAALGRLARLEDVEGSAEFLAALPDHSPFFKLAPRAVTPTAAFGNRTDVLKADVPAGGKMSARAVARMYAALLDEVDGVRLISPERLREVAAVAFRGADEIFGSPTTRGHWGTRSAVLGPTRTRPRPHSGGGASAGAVRSRIPRPGSRSR